MKDSGLVLIGGGGHALSVASAIKAEVAGYVDLIPKESMPWTYLGNDDEYLNRGSDNEVIITLVSGSDCILEMRKKLIARYDSFVSKSHVSPDAILDESAATGAGSVVMRRAVVNCRSILGRHCVVNTGAIVEHDCCIGNNVFIGPGAVICGGVTIGDDVYIGAGAVVRPGSTICSGCIIGLGAAVVNDLDEPGTYIGVPAKLSVRKK